MIDSKIIIYFPFHYCISLEMFIKNAKNTLLYIEFSKYIKIIKIGIHRKEYIQVKTGGIKNGVFFMRKMVKILRQFCGPISGIRELKQFLIVFSCLKNK